MARDHRKLRVFADAHQLTLLIYKHTRHFPRDEWYVTRLQMRKAAVSVPSNLVEGSARRTTREYVNFLNISRASAAELNYLIDLTAELSFFHWRRIQRAEYSMRPGLPTATEVAAGNGSGTGAGRIRTETEAGEERACRVTR
jgi:four helix bundle protein